jgi:hypothetical protein
MMNRWDAPDYPPARTPRTIRRIEQLEDIGWEHVPGLPDRWRSPNGKELNEHEVRDMPDDQFDALVNA